MSGQLQPKRLGELAFSGLTTFLEDKARELMTSASLKEINLSSEILFQDTRICEELKQFFHGKRLPPSMANEMTDRLLLKLNNMYTEYKVHEYNNCYQQIIGSNLVEIFMHPDVTEISLSRNYLQERQVPSFANICGIMLRNMDNLHKLKNLNLRHTCRLYDLYFDVPIFPGRIQELTHSVTFTSKELRSIAESCPELKTFKLWYIPIFTESIPIILEMKHLETLHLLDIHASDIDEDYAAPMNIISTDITTSTIRSFGLELREENTLRQIVVNWPHLTEIILDLRCDVNLESLVQLRNLRSLSLISPFRWSEAYKNVLPSLGENLLALYLAGKHRLDLELIGQTCSKLKRLYLHDIRSNRQYARPSLKKFPNFKTVDSLKVSIRCDPDWTNFIIDQCININELHVSLYSSLHSIIAKVIERTPIDKVQEVHWWAKDTNGNYVQDIRSTYPNIPLKVNFKYVYPEFAVFYLNGSQHSFEEDFSMSLNELS